jgi:hypothetical protein
LFRYSGRRLIMAMTANIIVGLAGTAGQKAPQETNRRPNRRNENGREGELSGAVFAHALQYPRRARGALAISGRKAVTGRDSGVPKVGWEDWSCLGPSCLTTRGGKRYAGITCSRPTAGSRQPIARERPSSRRGAGPETVARDTRAFPPDGPAGRRASRAVRKT